MRHLALWSGLTLLALLNLSASTVNAAAEGKGHYTVIGPGTLHPEKKYNVAVAVHHTKEPTTLKVGLVGPSYNDIKTVELKPDEVKNIEFDVPTLEKGDYNLTAEGVSGMVFKNTTKLHFEKFNTYTKIQTDKSKYKPGDVVNFRVLFLDENLKPGLPDKDALIWFEDGKRNRIKEFKNLKVSNGVYTDKFQISEYAVLGPWNLVVKNGAQYNTEVYFEVEKYVLPKYEVKVTATDAVSVRDGDVNIVVKANYTYGKPVEGRATVVLGMYETSYWDSSTEEKSKSAPTILKSTDMVNGKAKFDLNVKEFKDSLTSKDYATSIMLTATVEENFTGVKLNSTTSILVYPYRYDMTCVSYSTCGSFQADNETEVVMQVRLVDGTPVTDTKSVAKLHYIEELSEKYYWRGKMNPSTTTTTTPKPEIESKTFTFESNLNGTGFAHFKVKLPDLKEYENYMHFYRVKMDFIDEKRNITNSYQRREPKKVDPSPSDTWKEPTDYFKMHVNYAKDKYTIPLNEKAIVTVNSSVPLNYLVMDIIGRGNVLQHERIQVPDNAKVYNITIIPTFLMSPYTKIYIYYVDENNEFHYAETSMHVDVQLQNQIEITAPTEVKPGADVPLLIKTAPHSFVGLMAVDQSVILLGGTNDIDPQEYNWRLGGYDTNTPWQGGYSHYPGEYTGVVTLTDADYFYNWTKPIYHIQHLARGPALKTTTIEMDAEVNRVAYAGGAVGAPAGPPVPAAAPPPPPPRVRKNFAETWLFENIEDTQTEEFTWSKQIPDTITSWVLTGFSVNPTKGLGVTKAATKIKTFQPFFIALRLPYSVKRGEVINVPALVFNYLEKDLDVEITLDNSDGEYEFTEVTNEVIDTAKRTKTVRVPAYSSAGVSFMLRPKTIGNIMLKYTANSPIAADAVHKTLKVVPEGVTEYANRAYFVNLKNTPEFKESFDLVLPTEVVPDSEHIEFTVIGDLLGPLVSNLDHLVRMPTGCAEQTMSSLVPNYLVLRYLESIKKLTPALKSQILNNLEAGYQRILNYRLDDGSFSSFGIQRDTDKPFNGSTWLTAYVVRSLYQIKQHIKVDDKVLKEGLDYLVTQQADNGTFLESNDFFYFSYRKPITLTANVLLTFVETPELSAPYQSVIDKGFKYVLDNMDKENDLHVKAMATYALHKSKNPIAEEQLKQLKALAKTEDDRMWWSQQKQPGKHWWRWSFSNDVEITSYVMLTMLGTGKETVDSLLPIIKWMVAQRNSYGGFSSTQDTVVGLQALIKFAEFVEYEAAVMDIEVAAKGGKEKRETLKVNEENALLLQSVELPHKTLGVDFTAKGKGAALVQVAYQYNVHEKEQTPAFSIKAVINKEAPAFKLNMDVCVEYTGEGVASNMALLEVSLPSGYVADEDSFEHIKTVPHVKQIETKKSETLIVVYFDTLRKGEAQCLPIEGLRQFPVARQKPASIVVYDYYDTTKKATDFYEVVAKVCDICEDDDECKKACK